MRVRQCYPAELASGKCSRYPAAKRGRERWTARNGSSCALWPLFSFFPASTCQPDPDPDPDPDPPGPYSCTVEVDPSTFENQVIVRLTVTNNQDHPVYYIARHNPWSKPDDEFFALSREGQAVECRGPVAHYPAATLEDVSELAPGQTLRTDYLLSDYYRFKAAGSYQADPAISLPVVSEGTPPTSPDDIAVPEWVELPCNTVEFMLDSGIPAAGFVAANDPDYPRLCMRYDPNNNLDSCRPRIEAACEQHFSAQAIHNLHRGFQWRVQRVFEQFPSNAAALAEFFGPQSQARDEAVTAAFNRVKNVFWRSVVRYQCFGRGSPACVDAKGNADRIIAFVIPSQTHPDIYLCPAFYRLDQNGGVDSAPGVLVHEATHVRPIFTQDHVYGISNARALARISPARAVANADNYEYFFELYGPKAGESPVAP